MCKCTPEIKTPFCGVGDCKWPTHKAKIHKVYKYGTGQPIPEGAVYLSTQVEKRIECNSPEGFNVSTEIHELNMLVWHYFLVEVDE